MSYKTAHIATSVFGLHYLTIFHKKDACLIWIKLRPIQFELWRLARRCSTIIYPGRRRDREHGEARDSMNTAISSIFLNMIIPKLIGAQNYNPSFDLSEVLIF